LNGLIDQQAAISFTSTGDLTRKIISTGIKLSSAPDAWVFGGLYYDVASRGFITPGERQLPLQLRAYPRDDPA